MDQQIIGRMAERFNLGVDPYYVVALGFLIFARTVPMVAMSPIFGGKTVNNQIKVGFAMILSVCLFPILYPTLEGKLPTQGVLFWGLIIKEVGIGGLIGFATSLMFTAVEASGHLLDVQRGTAQASVLVPQLEFQGPVFAQLQVQLSVVLFFALNLHHIFLRGYYESFMTLPVSDMPHVSNDFFLMIKQMIIMSGKIFSVSMQLIAPVLLALFMCDVVLGTAGRIAPSVNVTFLGQPIKAAVGIIMFVMAFKFILIYIGKLYTQMMGDLVLLLKILG
jgi:flagellar biosynthetic protein FliR